MRARANPEARQFARAQRRAMTEAEILLWSHLRRKQCEGIRFRRQVAIASYVADFASLRPKPVIEIDGSQHSEAHVYDTDRSAFLERQGYRVLRFWNHEVFQERQTVLATIWRAATDLRGG